MINIIKNIILPLAILILICESCVKDDIEQIDNKLVFNPEYSIPIGEKEVILDEFVPQNLTSLTDTTGIPTNRIFYYDGSYYDLRTSIFYKNSFLTFDFSKLTENFESIESLMFRVNSVNKIPAQCELMVYFSNGTGTETSLLFTDGWYKIEAAQYSDNNIIPSEQYKKDTYYDKNAVQSLFDKRTIIISMRLSVENPTDEIIKYLSTQSLEVQFALRFSFESTSNEI